MIEKSASVTKKLTTFHNIAMLRQLIKAKTLCTETKKFSAYFDGQKREGNSKLILAEIIGSHELVINFNKCK